MKLAVVLFIMRYKFSDCLTAQFMWDRSVTYQMQAIEQQ